eukprot:GHVQ01008804.1.p1 GENE.GHVQ01008804.1~~GHVQ01008804.1.p1  ORF type:complete len:4630 (+),score=744.88 GHVQ01008804.1:433-13890(+)
MTATTTTTTVSTITTTVSATTVPAATTATSSNTLKQPHRIISSIIYLAIHGDPLLTLNSLSSLCAYMETSQYTTPPPVWIITAGCQQILIPSPTTITTTTTTHTTKPSVSGLNSSSSSSSVLEDSKATATTSTTATTLTHAIHTTLPLHAGLWGYARTARLELQTRLGRPGRVGCIDVSLDMTSAATNRTSYGDEQQQANIGGGGGLQEEDTVLIQAVRHTLRQSAMTSGPYEPEFVFRRRYNVPDGFIKDITTTTQSSSSSAATATPRAANNTKTSSTAPTTITPSSEGVKLSTSTTTTATTASTATSTTTSTSSSSVVRFVSRLKRTNLIIRGAVELHMPERGALSNLVLRPQADAAREPPPHGKVEIRVRAVGLNFRDVLNVLGLYPGEPGRPGGDCAGTVVAVGDGVHHVAVGDAVYGVAPGCLKTYVTTDARILRRLPTSLSFEEAACLPVVMVTVELALRDLAKVHKGEKVLIHAASGGVGISAINFCKHIGAEVYGTCGNDKKKAFVTAMGVKFVGSSRDIETFKADMTAAGINTSATNPNSDSISSGNTDPCKLDVVLNTLIGEYIPASVDMLTHKGRFMELGKRGIWTHQQMKTHRPDIYYETIAVDTMLLEGPEWFGGMLDRVRIGIDCGQITKLPMTLYSMYDSTAEGSAVAGFRFMQRAQHVGKVVIGIPSALEPYKLPSLLPQSQEAGATTTTSPTTTTSTTSTKDQSIKTALPNRRTSSATGSADEPVLLPPVTTIYTSTYSSTAQNKSYIISGGMGGLGLVIAKWLVEEGAKHLILLSRSCNPTDPETLNWLQQHSDCRTVKCDVSVMSEVVKVLDLVRTLGLPPIGGLFHAAGVTADATLALQTEETLKKVYLPKVRGAWNFHEALEAHPSPPSTTPPPPLDIFMLFSSVTAVFGNFGQANYSAANSALDSLAVYRRSLGLAAQSIQWGPWVEQGMAVDIKHLLDKAGMKGISNELGLRVIGDVLRSSDSVGVTCCQAISWKAFMQRYDDPTSSSSSSSAGGGAGESPPFFSHIDLSSAVPSKLRELFRTMGPDELEQYVRKTVIETAGQVLGTTEMPDLDSPLQELGIDSLGAVELRNALSTKLAVKLAATTLFDYPTINAIIDHIYTQVSGDALSAKDSSKTGGSATGTPTTAGLSANLLASSEGFAIVGMACRLPGNCWTPDGFWSMMERGHDTVCEIPLTRFDANFWYNPDADLRGKCYVDRACFLTHADHFDSSFFNIPSAEVLCMDPQQRMILEVSYDAFYSAGYLRESLLGQQFGVFIGCCNLDWHFLDLQSNPERSSSYSGTGGSGCLVSNRVSYVFGVRGTSLTVDTACSSSLVATDVSIHCMQLGQVTGALVGGINLMLSAHLFVAFSKARMLSPDCRCASFDDRANGYVRGEGAGAVVVLPMEEAKKKGSKILAVVKGSATNHDGRSASLTAPNGPAQQDAIRCAVGRAAMKPTDITYVETHGTATSLGDPIEMGALKAVYGPGRSPQCPLVIGTLKSYVGHSEGAAGISELIRVVLCLQRRTALTNLHFEKLNPLMDLEGFNCVLPKEPTTLAPAAGRSRVVGCLSSFGFGGANAHLVVEEAVRTAQQEAEAAEVHRKKVAFLFTGQGSQYPRMCEQLAATEPIFRAALDRCGTILEGKLDYSLEDLLYPKPDADATTISNLLNETRHSQPVLFSIEYALVSLLAVKGITPDIVMGHSLGEYVAATIAGVMSLEDALHLVVRRAQIMESTPANDGAMAACRATPTEVADALEALPDVKTVAVAAINGPKSVVVSGNRTEVDRVLTHLKIESRAKYLAVSHAFHSPMMDPVVETFKNEFSSINLTTPDKAISFISTVTAASETTELTKASYWAKHISVPVRFHDALRALVQEGGQILVEIGPRPVLTRMGRQCIQSTEITWVNAVQDDKPNTQTFPYAVDQVSSSIVGRHVWHRQPFPWHPVQHPLIGDKILYDPMSTSTASSQSHIKEGLPTTTSTTNANASGNVVAGKGPIELTHDLSESCVELLQDHIVNNTPIMPGAGFIEILAAAGFAMLDGLSPTNAVELVDVEFERPMTLPTAPNPDSPMQITLKIDSMRSVQIGSFIADTDENLHHGMGRVVGMRSIKNMIFGEISELDNNKKQQHNNDTNNATSPTTLDEHILPVQPSSAEHTNEFVDDLFKLQETVTTEVDISTIYSTLASVGLQYGPRFQAIKKCLKADNQVLAQLSLPQKLPKFEHSFRIHPAILDGAFQSAAVLVAELGSKTAMVPVSVASAALGRIAVDWDTWSHVSVVKKDLKSAQLNVRLFTSKGKLIGWLKQLVVRAIDTTPMAEIPKDLLWEVQWVLPSVQDSDGVSSPISTESIRGGGGGEPDATATAGGSVSSSSGSSSGGSSGDSAGDGGGDVTPVVASSSVAGGTLEGYSSPTASPSAAKTHAAAAAAADAAAIGKPSWKPFLLLGVQPDFTQHLNTFLAAECKCFTTKDGMPDFQDFEKLLIDQEYECILYLGALSPEADAVDVVADCLSLSQYLVMLSESTVIPQLIAVTRGQELIEGKDYQDPVHRLSLLQDGTLHNSNNNNTNTTTTAVSVTSANTSTTQTPIVLPPFSCIHPPPRPTHSGVIAFLRSARLEIENTIGKQVKFGYIDIDSSVQTHPLIQTAHTNLYPNTTTTATPNTTSAGNTSSTTTNSIVTSTTTTTTTSSYLERCIHALLTSKGPYEPEVAFRGKTTTTTTDNHYVTRLIRTDSECRGAVELFMSDRGALSLLKLRPLAYAARMDPPEGCIEIRVRAVGLNFRDVLNVMGLYPGDPGPPGADCAGTVVAIGQGVSGRRRIGDNVYGVASGCLKSFVTTSADLLCEMPESLVFEEAAALPVVAVTVELALDDLAKTQKGERVLVHAVTGGVGLAAVQYCKRIGAVIYGTCSGGKKADYVRSQGVTNLATSRDADKFEAEMKSILGPDKHIHVCLNSLFEDFIPASVRLLAQGGRFLELGKRGIWSEAKMTTERPDIFYRTIAVDTMTADDPSWFRGMLERVRTLVDSHQLTTLPLHIFEMSTHPDEGAIAAFRFMQRAQHIGKVLIRLPSALSPAPAPGTVSRTVHAEKDIDRHNNNNNTTTSITTSPLKAPSSTNHSCYTRPVLDSTLESNKTYIISGGLGALGLVITRWLIEEGARHIVLLSRRGGPPPDVVQSPLWQWIISNDQRAKIYPVKCDVSRQDDCVKMLTNIHQQLGCPRVRGLFHAAGVLADAALPNQSRHSIEEVYLSKVTGAWNLQWALQQAGLDCVPEDETTLANAATASTAGSTASRTSGVSGNEDTTASGKASNGTVSTSTNTSTSTTSQPPSHTGSSSVLEVFMMFSSVSTLLGNFGQANYAAANAALNALTQWRRSQGLAAQSIMWGPWTEQGMAAGLVDVLDKAGLRGITNELGLRVLGDVMRNPTTHSVLCCQSIVWKNFLRRYAFDTPTYFSQVNTLGMSASDVGVDINTVSKDELTNLILVLAQQVSGSAELPAGSTPVLDLGLDSLGAVEFRNSVADVTGTKLPQNLIFDNPTVEGIAAYIIERAGRTDGGVAGGSSPRHGGLSPSGRQRPRAPILDTPLDQWLMSSLDPQERFALYIDNFSKVYDSSLENLANEDDIMTALENLGVDDNADFERLHVAWTDLCDLVHAGNNAAGGVSAALKAKAVGAVVPKSKAIHPLEDIETLKNSLSFDISKTKPVVEPQKVKKVLLTGATGFVGRVQLATLLRRGNGSLLVYCIVRAKSETHGLSRIKAACEEAKCWEEAFTKRIIPIPGDFEKPILGLTDKQWKELCTEVDVVYHTGGDVNLLSSYMRLRATNTLAVTGIIDLCTSVKLKPCHFASTLGQFPAFFAQFAGEFGNHTLTEDSQPDLNEMERFYPPIRQGYPWSKWAAEQVLRKAKDMGLPVYIYRLPNTYVGHDTGYTNKLDYAAALMIASIQEGVFPIGAATAPLTPVDTICNMIIETSFLEKPKHWMYHLVDPRLVTRQDLESWAQEVGISYKGVQVDEFITAVKTRGPTSPVFKFLPLMQYWRRFWFDPKERTTPFPIRFQNIIDELPHMDWPPLKEIFVRSFVYGMSFDFFPDASKSLIIDPALCLADAQRMSGNLSLSDPSFYMEPSKILAHSLTQECKTTFAGKLMHYRGHRQHLMNVMFMEQRESQNPKILQQPISRPLIVVGLNRTGTTFLQKLLATDGGNRPTYYYEMLTPYGEDGKYDVQGLDHATTSREEDPRIEYSRNMLEMLEAVGVDEEWAAIHEQRADQPEEEFMILEQCGRSYSICTECGVPSYREWLFKDDFAQMKKAYKFHKRFLQHLQWQNKGERWMLKMPFHLFALDALVETYPDAMIVFMHRDPKEIMGSWGSLVSHLQSHMLRDVDKTKLGSLELDAMSTMIQRAIAFRNSRPDLKEQFIDVQYKDFVYDPTAAVKKIYKHFNLTVSKHFNTAMSKFISDNRKNRDKLTKHLYSLADVGLTEEDVQQAFKAYYESGLLKYKK